MVHLVSIVATLLGATSVVLGASLQQVSGFGNNPTGAQMWIYVPDRLQSNPPILAAIHYCSGTAQAYYSGTQYSRLADQYGFIVIYPSSPNSGGCWDVNSQATFRHDAGGDSLAIANMVRYALQRYNGNPDRVFATGTSSGAMMSQVLAGAYPDLFKGISAFAGVPFGCFAASGLWNSECAQGRTIKTAQQWGDLVRAGYPEYTGPRPKVQLWHGTNDETINYNNFGESVKQWTNVLGLSETPTSTQSNSPVSGWTRRHYGPNMQAISAQGVSHGIPVQENDVLAFFGLNQVNPTTTTAGPTSTSTTGPTTTTSPTITSQPSTINSTSPPVPTTTQGPTVPKWGQCGGRNYNGPTQCVAGSAW